MLLSVIIPVYNSAPFLDQCVGSLRDARLTPDLEIVAVDDGSTDESGAMLDRFKAELPNFRVIHQPNAGVTTARRTGAEHATGDYVFCLDSDDEILPDAFVTYLETLRERSPDMLAFAMKQGDAVSQNKVAAGFYDGAALDDVRDRFVSPNNDIRTLHYSICTKIVRRELFTARQRAVPPTLTIGEDFFLVYTLLRDVRTLAVSDEVGYLYRVNTASVSRTFREEKFYRLDELVKSFLTVASENEVVDLAYTHLLQMVLSAAQSAKTYREFREMIRRSHAYTTLWTYAMRQKNLSHTPKDTVKYLALKHGLLRVLYRFVYRPKA